MESKLKRSSASMIIGVAGGTASGKTTLVRAFVEECGPDTAESITLDSYYFDQSSLPQTQRDSLNFDHPSSIDFRALGDDLERLAEGYAISLPNYDFATHSRNGSRSVSPRPIIVVEGILALSNESIRGKYDLCVFVDAIQTVRLRRRVDRDVNEHRSSAEEATYRFSNHCMPMHAKHVEPTRDLADYIVRNEGNIQVAICDFTNLVLAAHKQFRVASGDSLLDSKGKKLQTADATTLKGTEPE